MPVIKRGNHPCPILPCVLPMNAFSTLKMSMSQKPIDLAEPRKPFKKHLKIQSLAALRV
jgi:hypothetical protein